MGRIRYGKMEKNMLVKMKCRTCYIFVSKEDVRVAAGVIGCLDEAVYHA